MAATELYEKIDAVVKPVVLRTFKSLGWDVKPSEFS